MEESNTVSLFTENTETKNIPLLVALYGILKEQPGADIKGAVSDEDYAFLKSFGTDTDKIVIKLVTLGIESDFINVVAPEIFISHSTATSLLEEIASVDLMGFAAILYYASNTPVPVFLPTNEYPPIWHSTIRSFKEEIEVMTHKEVREYIHTILVGKWA